MLHRPRASLIRYLCLLPFMVSVLVPAGLMPAVSGDGTITLVICTGHGPEERSFPADESEPDGASSWCPFSLLNASVLVPERIDEGRADQRETVQAVVIERDVPATSGIATSRPRGPPSIL